MAEQLPTSQVFQIVDETQKAFRVAYTAPGMIAKEKFLWVPKSCCTVAADHPGCEKETDIGRMLASVAKWWVANNNLRNVI